MPGCKIQGFRLQRDGLYGFMQNHKQNNRMGHIQSAGLLKSKQGLKNQRTSRIYNAKSWFQKIHGNNKQINRRGLINSAGLLKGSENPENHILSLSFCIFEYKIIQASDINISYDICK